MKSRSSAPSATTCGNLVSGTYQANPQDRVGCSAFSSVLRADATGGESFVEMGGNLAVGGVGNACVQLHAQASCRVTQPLLDHSGMFSGLHHEAGGDMAQSVKGQ